jgi:hypothetical protein
VLYIVECVADMRAQPQPAGWRSGDTALVIQSLEECACIRLTEADDYDAAAARGVERCDELSARYRGEPFLQHGGELEHTRLDPVRANLLGERECGVEPGNGRVVALAERLEPARGGRRYSDAWRSCVRNVARGTRPGSALLARAECADGSSVLKPERHQVLEHPHAIKLEAGQAETRHNQHSRARSHRVKEGSRTGRRTD